MYVCNVCESQTGHAGVPAIDERAFVPRLLGCSSASPGLPLHAQYTATTSSAACQETDRWAAGRPGWQTTTTRFPAVPVCRWLLLLAAGAPCCLLLPVQDCMLVGRHVSKISAIPPHPQITAVQKSHQPVPRGVAQRAVPEWKDRGGGVRRWDQDDERPILGADSSGNGVIPFAGCRARWAGWSVPLVLGFWVGRWKGRGTAAAAARSSSRRCNTTLAHRAENRHPCCCFPFASPHLGSHDQNCARGYSVGSDACLGIVQRDRAQ